MPKQNTSAKNYGQLIGLDSVYLSNVTEDSNQRVNDLRFQIREYKISKAVTWKQLATTIEALSGVGGVSDRRLRDFCLRGVRISDIFMGKLEGFLKRVGDAS